MPTAKLMHGAAVVNGKIYVIGGSETLTSDTAVTVHEYDPATDTWADKAEMPTPRDSLAVSVVNDKIYAIGGFSYTSGSEGKLLATIDEYDPATDTWTAKAEMPEIKSNPSSAVVDGKIYVMGGFPAPGPASTSVLAYDPLTDSWAERASLPAPRGVAASSMVAGRIYLFGGLDNTSATAVSTVFEYDPDTDTWQTKDDMPSEGQALSASALDGKVYVMGGSPGQLAQGPYSPMAWEYDVASAE
jgi:N-acetylneuraminic acid mutarotase